MTLEKKEIHFSRFPKEMFLCRLTVVGGTIGIVEPNKAGLAANVGTGLMAGPKIFSKNGE